MSACADVTDEPPQKEELALTLESKSSRHQSVSRSPGEDPTRIMRHRIAKLEDCEPVGELNHQLIKDEGHRNSMSIPELVGRMRDWLTNDDRASIFENDSGILAYALYREDTDLQARESTFERP